MSLEHLSHEKLCQWNTCHMKSYVTGTPVTCKVMSLEHLSHAKLSLEHLSHAKLCQWNTCHMKSYDSRTLVTCKVMSLEHLSHEQLCHCNLCHIFTFSKGNKWFKECCAISNTHKFSPVPQDPNMACKKADDCCFQNVILSSFYTSIKKKKTQEQIY